MDHDFFISYHHSDKDLADRTCRTLETTGIRNWIAPRDVPPGKEWAESIVEAIENAKALLLVFSARSNDSPQVKREIERAVHLGAPIFPVRVESVEPNKTMSYFLGLVHWLDVFEPSLEPHLPDLIAHAKYLLAEIGAATERPAFATGEGEASERVLQDFLDQISRSLSTLRSSVGPQADEAARVVRAQTLAVLPKMNTEQKGIALRALYLAGLVQQPQAKVQLAGADLSGVDLVGAMLPGVCLFSADLSRADLRGANLSNGNLQWANIEGTRFDGARLDGVVMSQTKSKTRALTRHSCVPWVPMSGVRIDRPNLRMHPTGCSGLRPRRQVMRVVGNIATNSPTQNSDILTAYHQTGPAQSAANICHDATLRGMTKNFSLTNHTCRSGSNWRPFSAVTCPPI